MMIRQKLQEHCWEVLLHPPYSTDLAPSEFHIFLSMTNALGGARMASREACENVIPEVCFANRINAFWESAKITMFSKMQRDTEQIDKI